MTSLVINSQAISQDNGFFSLNDLHKSSGNNPNHKPVFFLRNQETQEMIAELEKENIIAYHTKQGKQGGTYACRELVYRYAMWISAKFSLMVIRAFDALNTGVIQCLQPKTTADDRTPLRQAVSMLVGKRGLDYSTAYTLVHQFMGVESIDEIAPDDLPKAVAYVHSLILNDMHGDRLIDSAQQLAWHTSFIYSWYKAIEEPFRSLSPKLSYQIHDHVVYAKICASHIEQQVGFGGMDKRALEKKTWAVGFDGLS